MTLTALTCSMVAAGRENLMFSATVPSNMKLS
jgi:hypothetical protein